MSTAQRQIGTSSFRAPATPYASQITAAARPLPTRAVPEMARPGSRAAPAPRSNSQTVWLAWWLVMALLMVTAGLTYLSGYAALTREGYRRAHLLGMLRQEREMAQQWKQRQALVNTPAFIEHRAKTMGMVRADDAQTVTLSDR